MTIPPETTLTTLSPPSLPIVVEGLSDEDARLIRGIHNAQPDEVRAALAQGANVNLSDPNRRGQSPLTQSAIYLRAFPMAHEIHDLLLDAGAEVNAQEPAGPSVLDQALLFEQEDLAHKLLDRGARAHPVETIDTTLPAIARALVTHNQALVQRLLAAGASIPVRWGTQPMLFCVLEKLHQTSLTPDGVFELVDLVMTQTPPLSPAELKRALSITLDGADHPRVVARLIDAGADLTPIDVPQTFFVLDHTGEPTMLNATGWTALHAAAVHGRTASLDVLLGKGLDPAQRVQALDVGPLSAIDLARGAGHMNLVVRMEQHVLAPLMTHGPTSVAPGRARL